MNTSIRYVILVAFIIIGLHSILKLTHGQYDQATSLSTIKGKWSGNSPTDSDTSATEPVTPTIEIADNESEPEPPSPLPGRRANATLFMLARNSDLEDAVRSVRRLEDRFNRYYNYPWLFLNDDDFSENFKQRISILTSGKATFGKVPRDHWVQPDWIDEEKASASRQSMVAENVIYGGSVSYRNMCRFNSGYFFQHPLLQEYRWYWRVEPSVDFHCDIEFDPFVFMENNNKTYGFTITPYEWARTIETLWPTVREFMHDHPEYIAENNAMDFISNDGGLTYNLCHFWSNFEIADMDFWRGPAYQAFFNYLESKGGFYYERWGDAPVHSIAVALFQEKSQIHFFDDIGYEHPPFSHCPRKEDAWKRGKCSCDRLNSFDFNGYSCLAKWDSVTWQP